MSMPAAVIETCALPAEPFAIDAIEPTLIGALPRAHERRERESHLRNYTDGPTIKLFPALSVETWSAFLTSSAQRRCLLAPVIRPVAVGAAFLLYLNQSSGSLVPRSIPAHTHSGVDPTHAQ